jgi:hypothetical protein
MKRKLACALGGFAALALQGRSAVAQNGNAVPVYYLSVGSSDYSQASRNDSVRGWLSFERLPSASKSATLVGSFLASAGSPFGITLTSDASHLVTRTDVFAALDSVITVARRARGQRPLLFIYLAAHGVSEGIAWNHFTAPGTFKRPRRGTRVPLDILRAEAVYTGDLADALKAAELPFVLVLDNCQSGKAERFTSPALTQTAEGNIDDAVAILRHMNEFHTPDPVIFSTAPGTEVSDVADPLDEESPTGVAPLGRRMLLVYSRALQSHHSVTLAQFVAALKDPSFDPATSPAVTFAELASNSTVLISSAPARRGVHPRLVGGSLRARTATRVTTRLQYQGRSTVTIQSQSGDYVGQGGRFNARDAITQVVHEPNGEVVLKIQSTPDWEIHFFAPNRAPLHVGSYLNAGRHFSDESSRPGLDVFGEDRGCNEPSGSFDVQEVSYDSNGAIRTLSVTFQQHCTAMPPLRGTLSFRR